MDFVEENRNVEEGDVILPVLVVRISTTPQVHCLAQPRERLGT
jgi:hypothetical protein